MNEITERKQALPSLAMDEGELIAILGTSLYPGANQNSIRLVLGYCKASGLDPMQKPVHIVPMWDRNSKSMRDVIMPGVGLYRTNAARTNQLAGISEPEFGPDVTVAGFIVPEWCRVTVKRLVAGRECDFTAREYWVENYATVSKDTDAPNAMWKKRARGQLAKCAQAQALRMAFPEAVGAAPTADEMDGKFIEDDVPPESPRIAATPAPAPKLPTHTAESMAEAMPSWRKVIESGRKTHDQVLATVRTIATLTAEQEAEIRAIKAPAAPVTEPKHGATDAQAKPVAIPVQSSDEFYAGLGE